MSLREMMPTNRFLSSTTGQALLAGFHNVRVEAKVLERLVSEQAAQCAGVPAVPAMLMAETAAAVP
jgi:hypothetical protein